MPKSVDPKREKALAKFIEDNPPEALPLGDAAQLLKAEHPKVFQTYNAARGALSRYAEKKGLAFQPSTSTQGQKPNVEIEANAKTGVTQFHFNGRVPGVPGQDKQVTVRQLLETSGIDPKEWEITKINVKAWGVTAKIKKYEWVRSKGGDERTVPTEQYLEAGKNYGISVTLERKKEKPDVLIEEAIERLVPKLRRSMSRYRPLKHIKRHSKDDLLLELAIFDLHVGKLSWGEETEGADWNTKISASNFLAALDHMLNYNGEVDRIVLPVGNDFFHVDTVENTTTRGTRQDVDTRWAKAFDIGCDVLIHGVQMCLEKAPVDIIVVPGNHDMQKAYSMGRVVDEAFNHVKAVTIDRSPPHFKKYRWGCNLLGFTHGDEVKPERLPAEMAVRWPQEWARTLHREWHIGHTHGMRNKVMVVEGHEDQEVRVRTIPSLCPQDAWHAKRLYRNIRAAESYIWSRKDGYVGHNSCPAKLTAPAS